MDTIDIPTVKCISCHLNMTDYGDKAPICNFCRKDIALKKETKSLKNPKLRAIIHRVASGDESFLYNNCIDIADIMNMVMSQLVRMKRSELLKLYEKAKLSDSFASSFETETEIEN